MILHFARPCKASVSLKSEPKPLTIICFCLGLFVSLCANVFKPKENYYDQTEDLQLGLLLTNNWIIGWLRK